MKRVLLVMTQPPGSSGVQGLIYNKLLPFFEDLGWEIHFAGPDPKLFSVLTEQLDYPTERLHYAKSITPSLRFSIQKNRRKKRSLPYLFFGVLQLLARIVEKVVGHDSDAFFLKGMEKTVRDAETQWSFDLIAGKSPEFKVLSLVSRITRSLDKPFLAMVVDPYGARDAGNFYPKTPELQTAILEQSCGALFMSPLTMERYIAAGLVPREKAYYFTDSYPEMPWLYQPNCSALAQQNRRPPLRQSSLQMIYLGMLPEWRPIEPLLEALLSSTSDSNDGSPPVQLSVFGYVYPAAQGRIADDQYLRQAVHIHPLVPYTDSHLLAEDADLQLVVIGPRHVDNYPSKFFEYLAHHKPFLVLGPPGNPLQEIVEELQIGFYVNGSDSQEIHNALQELRKNYAFYHASCRDHAAQMEIYSAHKVAEHFCHLLDLSLARAQAPRGL